MRYETLEDWLEWQSSSHPNAIDLGLERVKLVADRLQATNPTAKVVTVAGTNGKGSSVAFIESILLAEGMSVGCYTSPHITTYNERIRVNRELVSDATLIESFARIDAVSQDVTLTYFEWGTLAALDILGQAGLDVMVLEVGLGGRLDAVNVIDPDVALITQLGVDHTEWLGDTREAISLEKLGISREGRPLVCSDSNPPQVFVESANSKGVDLLLSGRDYSFEQGSDGWLWSSSSKTFSLPTPGLAGEHQLNNAAGAVMAVLQIPGVDISASSLQEGVRGVTLSGRFERISGELNLVLDVAHNADGSQMLANALRSSKPEGRDWCLLAVLSDKDARNMFEALSEVVDEWVLSSPNSDRALSQESLAQTYVEVFPGEDYLAANNVDQAFELVRKRMAPKDRLIVTGSFYTVAEVKAKLNNE